MKKKVSNKKICLIKTIKMNLQILKNSNRKKDDNYLLELPLPVGGENLIIIQNQMTFPESLRLLERIKRQEKFRYFYRNTDT